ncbi:apolipoprotein N-acyltransferase [Putridiphycobacter roseus]|uniref:Apolipoprotein N-acyltransferase n=1 Tax=Putridiphycobacter roseus TaxID=2219161 RepID=A0A2W1NGU1_9FLAO|nr:apolipoprotein N-acyltransferase [Putridiphycobacter roseus]PZE18313.1 apolipoprotein N-acyltransferase [Putridiphycobacter roseus]
MQISYLKSILILCVAALFLGLSFPYSGSLFPLVFIAFTPIIWFNVEVNKALKGRGVKRFLGNYIYMVIFNVVATWWIKNASLEGALMAFFANAFLMTLPFVVFGFFNRILNLSKSLIGLVAVWLSFEHLDHIWDLSWPWLSLGNAFGNHPALIQWYSYTGVSGGTLWVLLVNILVYVLYVNIKEKKETVSIQSPLFLLGAIMLLLPITSSLWHFYRYEEKVNPVEVVIVQPNLNPWNSDFTGPGVKFTTPTSQQISDMLDLASTKITKNTALIVFPETAISSYMDEAALDNMGVIFKLKAYTKEKGIPILTGADTYGLFEKERPFPAVKKRNKWFENYNTALLISGDDKIQKYHKAKLVLGAEKLPFVDLFPFMAKLSVDLGGTNSILVGNTYPNLFYTKVLKTAPLICYESVYGEYVSEFVSMGADFLCVITNDGWWGDTPGYKQHLIFSQIRAIENRRSLVRSANTGISCFINQKGEIVEALDWDKKGAMVQSINKNDTITFFTQYGDIIGRVSAFLLIGIFIMAVSDYLKSKGKTLKGF